MQISVTNAGPDSATLHVLPHLWFRNQWSWDVGSSRPALRASGSDRVAVDHPSYGELVWEVDADPDGAPPDLLFCENDTNVSRLFGSPDSPAFPKDGINDHVVTGAVTGAVAGATTVNPDRTGTKCAAWYRLTVGPGETQTVRVRLRKPTSSAAFGKRFDDVLDKRRRQADDFYSEVIPAGVTDDERLVARQAFAGMIWGKQFYAYNVMRWLDGDPTQPPPPPERRSGRNAAWVHMDARDIMSMPDPWEYPWFAAWDLAFHTGRARASRPGVREVPAAGAVPRVVPTSERRAPRVRVGVRRRESACARVGGAPRVGHRRTSRPRLPGPLAAEAAGELHLVGEPHGPRGRSRVRGRLPRARQHQRDRPLEPPARWAPRAIRRHDVDGVLRAHAVRDGSNPRRDGRRVDRHRAQVHRALRLDRRRDAFAGTVG